MKKPSIEKRFFFHGNAVALAAHVRRPKEFFVPSVAAACLPASGGIGQGEAKGPKSFGDIITYDSASTSVFGDFVEPERALKFTYGNHGKNDIPTVTVVEGKIAELRIAADNHVFQAGEMEARMDSFFDRKNAPRFPSLTAAFRRLSVNGVRVKVTVDCETFGKYDTLESLRQAYQRDAQFRARHAHQFFPPEAPSTGWFGCRKATLPEAKGIVYGTIVTELKFDGEPPRGVVINGNRITIDGFGSLYFGEILIEEGLRRLTLLRFQLGSPSGGEGAAIDLQCNGTGWPPRESDL